MKRVIKTLILASAAAVVLAPMQARADGFVTPWVGSAFGSNIQNGQTTFGVSAGGMGAGHHRRRSGLRLEPELLRHEERLRQQHRDEPDGQPHHRRFRSAARMAPACGLTSSAASA